MLRHADLPEAPVAVLGRTKSERIGRMVTDVVMETLAGGLTEIRMSEAVLQATIELRSFLFAAVYENARRRPSSRRPPAFSGGSGRRCGSSRSGSWTCARSRRRGSTAAARDFVAGMTDRYAVRLYEQLFIPTPWVELGG